MISLVKKHMQVLPDVLNELSIFKKFRGHFDLVLEFHTGLDKAKTIEVNAGVFWCSDVNSRYNQLIHTMWRTYPDDIPANDETARQIAISLMSHFMNYLTAPHALDSFVETLDNCSNKIKEEPQDATELDVSNTTEDE